MGLNSLKRARTPATANTIGLVNTEGVTAAANFARWRVQRASEVAETHEQIAFGSDEKRASVRGTTDDQR